MTDAQRQRVSEGRRLGIAEGRFTIHRTALPIGSRRIFHARGYDYYRVKVDETTRPWPIEHRWVVEQMIGRPLKPGEIVHHRNHDTLDNRPENLEVMSKAAHIRHHHELGTHKWMRSGEYDACRGCNRTDRRHFGRGFCYECWKVEKVARYRAAQAA